MKSYLNALKPSLTKLSYLFALKQTFELQAALITRSLGFDYLQTRKRVKRRLMKKMKIFFEFKTKI
jgi:hypothetical protein